LAPELRARRTRSGDAAGRKRDSRLEPVANPGFGDQMAGVGRIRFEAAETAVARYLAYQQDDLHLRALVSSGHLTEAIQ
jgi:hypothetical protein